METLRKLLFINFRLIIVLSILITYYEFKLSKYRPDNRICLSEEYIIINETKTRNFTEKVSLLEKDKLFFELNEKLNSLSRFENEFKNFINSIVFRESEYNLIKLENQEVETFKDLNK